MIRISNIKILEDMSDEDVLVIALKKFNILKSDVKFWKISKKSIDARQKNNVHYSYCFDLELKNENSILRKNKKIYKIDDFKFPTIIVQNKDIQPIIIGSGPAGLFAALTFVQNGIKPIIIEQGSSVDDRKKAVDEFISDGILNKNCNVQFGEGGAGTFSDGKLSSGINSPYCTKVLQEFVNFGAPKQILYLTKPHLGTDNLINIIRNMRNYIIENGGRFLFDTKFVDFEIINDKLSKIYIQNLKNNEITEITTDILILAIGHSSRDTFKKIYEKGINIEPKNFSVGVRIEHLQSEINKAQYGTSTKLKLPSAEYKLAYHSTSGRSCYTFCMCPGGVVIASSSEENSIVINGMSYFSRNGTNANSAVLVNVTPNDFKDTSLLSGMYFQKELEEKAFILGGKNYYAPIQRFEDFKNNKKSDFIGNIKPSYLPGTALSDLNSIFPRFISDTLKEGILYFDTKIKGFANADSILTGVETRSSSPIKILRDEKFVSNIIGIYPCGEGAGYAGGIMSAAVDGIKCAISILKN